VHLHYKSLTETEVKRTKAHQQVWGQKEVAGCTVRREDPWPECLKKDVKGRYGSVGKKTSPRRKTLQGTKREPCKRNDFPDRGLNKRNEIHEVKPTKPHSLTLQGTTGRVQKEKKPQKEVNPGNVLPWKGSTSEKMRNKPLGRNDERHPNQISRKKKNLMKGEREYGIAGE